MDLNWMIIAPLIAIQLILWIVAFLDLSRREAKDVAFGKKWPWVLIILLVSCGIGSILYLTVGRKNG